MAKRKHQDGDTIVIKKYANRRLYNTATSSYVTLDHLAELVKNDEDFVVRDAKSGEDITHSVLTQIIFEKESTDDTMLPLPFLRQLISLYGDGLQALVPGYLQSAMEALTQKQEEIRKAFLAGKGPENYMGMFEDMTRRNMALFQQTMQMFTPPGADKPSSAATNNPDNAAAQKDAEIQALKEQLASLQDKVDALSK